MCVCVCLPVSLCLFVHVCFVTGYPVLKTKTLKLFQAELRSQYMDCHVCIQFYRVNRSVHSLLGGDGHDHCHVYLEAFKQFKEDFKRLYNSEGKTSLSLGARQLLLSCLS